MYKTPENHFEYTLKHFTTKMPIKTKNFLKLQVKVLKTVNSV